MEQRAQKETSAQTLGVHFSPLFMNGRFEPLVTTLSWRGGKPGNVILHGGFFIAKATFPERVTQRDLQ